MWRPALALFLLTAFAAASAQPQPAPLPAKPASPPLPQHRPLDPTRHLPSKFPHVHDPSTILRDGDTYYVYSTGPGIPFLSSPDTITWTPRGTVFPNLPYDVIKYAPGNNGLDAWAPDIVRVGDTFLLYYAASKWGSDLSVIGLATNTTLNPGSQAYHWVDRGMVVRSDGIQNLNAIDPGVILTSKGELWLCFGSYHGNIELIPLNARTGLELKPHALPYVLANNSEASDIIEHEGFFYLFVNHGSCCMGAESTYHINVGRSRKITGPYVNRKGDALTDVPGEPFMVSENGRIGPGHFGRILEQPGAKLPERFSIHFESDPADQGKSTLAIRDLQWTLDGWPIAVPAPAGDTSRPLPH